MFLIMFTMIMKQSQFHEKYRNDYDWSISTSHFANKIVIISWYFIIFDFCATFYRDLLEETFDITFESETNVESTWLDACSRWIHIISTIILYFVLRLYARWHLLLTIITLISGHRLNRKINVDKKVTIEGKF